MVWGRNDSSDGCVGREEWQRCDMQRYKILLVDDETDVRQSIARTVDWEAEGSC